MSQPSCITRKLVVVRTGVGQSAGGERASGRLEWIVSLLLTQTRALES